jgi:hypothetical protein
VTVSSFETSVTSTRLYGATSQKTVIFIPSVVLFNSLCDRKRCNLLPLLGNYLLLLLLLLGKIFGPDKDEMNRKFRIQDEGLRNLHASPSIICTVK